MRFVLSDFASCTFHSQPCDKLLEHGLDIEHATSDYREYAVLPIFQEVVLRVIASDLRFIICL